MQKLAAAATTAINHIGQKMQSAEASPQTPLILKDDPSGRARIGEALALFHDALKTYGKQPDQMEAVTKLFMFSMSGYPVQKVIDAMAYYVRNFSDFPAPADIVQIIERGNKPPFDRAVYTTISKKDPQNRSTDEWKYLREYETYILHG